MPFTVRKVFLVASFEIKYFISLSFGNTKDRNFVFICIAAFKANYQINLCGVNLIIKAPKKVENKTKYFLDDMFTLRRTSSMLNEF